MGDAKNLRLVVEDDDGNRSVHPLSPGEVSIGREADNTVAISERNVSRRHAKLWLDGSGAGHVEDLGSYNGLFVNGTRIDGKVPVRPGDVLRVGDVQLELRVGGAEALGEEPTERRGPAGAEAGQRGTPAGAGAQKLVDESTMPNAGVANAGVAAGGNAGPQPLGLEPTVPGGPGPAGAAPATPQPPYAKLLCLGAPRLGVAFELTRHETTFGRTGESHVALDHPSISRAHASVRLEGQAFVVRDLNSANGTLVNGVAVQRAALAVGDVLELGRVRLRLVAADEVPTLTVAEQAQALAETRAALGKSRNTALFVGAGALAVVVALAVGLGLRQAPRAQVAATTPAVTRLGTELPATAGSGDDEAQGLLQQAQAALNAHQYARAGALANAVLAVVPKDALKDGPKGPHGATVAAAQGLVELAATEEHGEQAIEAARKAAAARNWPDAFNALQEVPQASSFAAEATTLLKEVRPALVADRMAEAKESAEGHDWDEVELLVQEVVGLGPSPADQPELQRLRDALAEARRHGGGKSAAKEGRDNRSGAGKRTEATGDAGRTGRFGHGGRADEPSERRGHGGSEDAKALYAEGTRALAQGQLQRAIDDFNRCLVADKGYSMCYRALGIAYAKGGSGQKAARFYRLYLKVDPSARDAAQVRALLQQYNSQSDAAESGG